MAHATKSKVGSGYLSFPANGLMSQYPKNFESLDQS